MEIKGNVHLFFEQSGTFKDQFIKLGINAFDYDIQNEFNKTDFIIDLFSEISKSFESKPSIFDSIKQDDLIIAFFPCIYFETMSLFDFQLSRNGTKNKPISERIEYALNKLEKRTEYHKYLYKLYWIADTRKLRLIIENPATQPNYLITGQNFINPSIIDVDRTLRGDFFKKPTAYYFINCKPTFQTSISKVYKKKIITDCKRSNGNGLCSIERSLISPVYARNFICDFILKKKNTNTIPELF